MASKEVPYNPFWSIIPAARGKVHPNRFGEHYEWMDYMVQRLPEHHQKIVLMVFSEQMTLEQVGQELGLISKQAASQRVKRALEALRAAQRKRTWQWRRDNQGEVWISQEVLDG